MYAGTAPQRVAAGQRVWNPRKPRDRQACADRVTGAQQRAQVRAMHRPQWRGDQMIPAPMLAGTTLARDLSAGSNVYRRAAHRLSTRSEAVAAKGLVIRTMLRGASRPSQTTDDNRVAVTETRSAGEARPGC